MRVRNPKAVHISNKIIQYILHAYRDGYVTLAPFEVNSLKSELTRWSGAWLATKNIIFTSGSRISAIDSERSASRLYFQTLAKIKDFESYNNKHGSHHIYGYEFTINPSKLTYKSVSQLNRKIMRKLKTNAKIALIFKAVEHTYCHLNINVHLHYLIVATSRINQRNAYRKIKAIAKKFTHGSVNQSTSSDKKPYRSVDDWSKAVSYITKQAGRFPLMMVHDQWQKFLKLSIHQRIELLAKDYNDGKGIELHRFYVNSSNSIAKTWHNIKINQKYCKKNGVLVHIRNNRKAVAENRRMSVFSKPLDKIVTSDQRKPYKPFSRHHYSEKEMLSAYYGKGVYGWTKQPTEAQQISLF